MKLLKDVEKIFKKKYLPFVMPDENFKNIYKYIEEFPEEKSKFVHIKNDKYFIQKYKENITVGYYGFSTNSYTPENWADILDNVLDLCIQNDPKFEIHQIKLKFGAIRFYVVSEVIEDIYEIEKFISSKFYSAYLIY